MTELAIRPAREADWPRIYALLAPVFAAGDTYPVPRDMSEAETRDYWLMPAHSVFIAERDGVIVGTYYLMANQNPRGGGAHVANCGYITGEAARGHGVARAMCMHSLDEARRRGFVAMQFNFVISTNAPAVHLWQSCGFEVVGRLPGAYRHPSLGVVDALVLFRAL